MKIISVEYAEDNVTIFIDAKKIAAVSGVFLKEKRSLIFLDSGFKFEVKGTVREILEMMGRALG